MFIFVYFCSSYQSQYRFFLFQTNPLNHLLHKYSIYIYMDELCLFGSLIAPPPSVKHCPSKITHGIRT